MVSIRLDAPAEATIPAVARRLGIEASDLDPDFGVTCLDDKKRLYAILVDAAVAARLEGRPGVEGSFANPPIEPFGPPRPGRRRRGKD